MTTNYLTSTKQISYLQPETHFQNQSQLKKGSEGFGCTKNKKSGQKI